MSELIQKLNSAFQDEEYRHSYAEECLNTMIATQIKVLREQRELTQDELAVKTGMRQPRIPLLEDSNYSNWTLNTLKRFAKAFDLALSVKFETFSKVVTDFENMSREALQRVSFAQDVQFRVRRDMSRRRLRRKLHFQTQKLALSLAPSPQMSLFEQTGQLLKWPSQQNSALSPAAPIPPDSQKGDDYAIGLGNYR